MERDNAEQFWLHEDANSYLAEMVKNSYEVRKETQKNGKIVLIIFVPKVLVVKVWQLSINLVKVWQRTSFNVSVLVNFLPVYQQTVASKSNVSSVVHTKLILFCGIVFTG